MEHPELSEWSMYAFHPSETPIVGKWSREMFEADAAEAAKYGWQPTSQTMAEAFTHDLRLDVRAQHQRGMGMSEFAQAQTLADVTPGP